MSHTHLPEELLAIIVEFVSQEKDPDLRDVPAKCPQFKFNELYYLSLATRQLRRLSLPQLFSHIILKQKNYEVDPKKNSVRVHPEDEDIVDLTRIRREVIQRNALASLVRFALLTSIF